MEVPVYEGNVFRCKMAECTGNMTINLPPEIKLVGCPRCGIFNCRICNAVHTGMTCRQYQERGQQILNQPVPQLLAPPVQQNPAVVRPINPPPIVRPINPPIVIQPIPANPQRPIAVAQRRLQQNPVEIIRPAAMPIVKPQDGIHFNCKRENCPGFLNLRNIENIKLIACPVCNTFNCYSCQAIHNGLNCKQYREKMGLPLEPDAVVQATQKENVPMTSAAAQNKILIEELHALDDLNLILNSSSFVCPVCTDDINPNDGVIIRSCAHECCKSCLADMIEHNERAVIPCINPGCAGTLQDREIRELVTPAIFDKYTKRSLLEAQKCIPNLYMCCTPDCGGMWCVDEENNLPNHRCGMCKRLNCHKCKAVHENITCKQYKENYANQNDPNVLATLKAIDEQLQRGDIMYCPGCQAIVERDEGCSWIMCPLCKTEICWATRGPRWGPNGQNDTSGGCKCDYRNGKKCHPDCNYCH